MDDIEFIVNCFNCAYCSILSFDNITIDIMYCDLTDYKINDRYDKCDNFEISESAKIRYRMSDEEVKEIRSEFEK